MKLIIQIPCFNEAETLKISLDALPKEIPGIDVLEYLIIDDGSEDGTHKVAEEWGVHHIVRQPRNMGLAKAFMRGLDECLEQDADIIVNTDADNQYNADDIKTLVKPILDNEADLVIGERPIEQIEHFSPIKKILQRLGSGVVRKLSGVPVADAPSGFRALTRDTAMQLNVFNSYTYTLETIIQAGQSGLRVTNTPVRVNEDLRPSRLVKSISSYIRRSIGTILRIFVAYRPLKFFSLVAAVVFTLGLLLGIRFLVYYFMGEGQGHTQSLILAAVLLLAGYQTFTLGILGDIISVNRKLLEDIQLKERRRQYERLRDGGSN